jgi:hypothetical protein
VIHFVENIDGVLHITETVDGPLRTLKTAATPIILDDREPRGTSYRDSPWASTRSMPSSIASGEDYPFAERALIVIEPPVLLEQDSPDVFIVTEDEYEYVPDIVAPTDDASSLPSLIREEPSKSWVFILAATSVVESVGTAIDGQLSFALAMAIAAPYGTILCFLPTVV